MLGAGAGGVLCGDDVLGLRVVLVAGGALVAGGGVMVAGADVLGAAAVAGDDDAGEAEAEAGG